MGSQPLSYNIQAVFDGDNSISAAGYATALNSTQYAVCTTTQYGYRASQSYVTLTVEPPKTDVTAPAGNDPPTQSPEGTTVLIPPPKTPEQLQQEAKDSGKLTTWHEFNWLFPWYRLHFVLWRSPQQMLDVGLSALGDDVMFPSSTFTSWINDFLRAIVSSYIIGWVGAEIAVLAAMQFGPQAFALTLLISVGVKWGLLSLAWNSIQALKSSFLGAYVSFILGAVGLIKMRHSGLVSLASGFLSAVNAATFWKFLYKFIYIPINLVFMLLMLNRLNELGGI